MPPRKERDSLWARVGHLPVNRDSPGLPRRSRFSELEPAELQELEDGGELAYPPAQPSRNPWYPPAGGVLRSLALVEASVSFAVSAAADPDDPQHAGAGGRAAREGWATVAEGNRY